MNQKIEYPPLLLPGFYPKTMLELRSMCVNSFPLSKSRKSIMDGLDKFVQLLADNKIIGNLWVDGSFLTQKLEPQDSDVVLEISSDTYDHGSDEQRQLLEKISNEDLKADYLCDSYVLINFPKNNSAYAQGEWDRAYWIKQYGFSRGDNYKGIVTVQLV